MKKIIVCLLVLNICVFSFSGLFVVNADGIVNLNSFKQCPRDPNSGTIEGSSNCKSGSYYYTKDVPPAGNLIYSSVYSDFRSLEYIYFNGTGTIDILDRDNNLIKTLNVSTQERVRFYVGNLKGFKFKYTGIELLGVWFGWNRAGIIICYAKEGFTDDNYRFYTSKKSVNLKDVEQQQQPEQQPEQESKPECDICSKIDSILDLIGKIEELIAELKKKDCDVCKKLDAILADTDAMNNNISRLKITTGYINSHVSNISTKLDSTNTHLDGIGTDIGSIKGSVEQSADFLEQISNKVDSLESIDSKLDSLEDIKGGITDIGNSLIPSTVPDFSAVVNKPDLPVLDIPNLSKQQDTNIYFSEKAFVGESESLPFAPEPKNWTDFNNKSLDLDEFERDEPLEQDEFEREKFERDEPLERDEFEREKFERDDPLERDEFEREKFERDDPLERDRPLERDEPLGG